jgi:hypothetical protein
LETFGAQATMNAILSAADTPPMTRPRNLEVGSDLDMALLSEWMEKNCA